MWEDCECEASLGYAVMSHKTKEEEKSEEKNAKIKALAGDIAQLVECLVSIHKALG